MYVREYLRSLVKDTLRNRRMAWFIEKMDRNGEPRTYKQCESACLQLVLDQATEVDEAECFAATAQWVRDGHLHDATMAMLDEVAHHVRDRVKAMVNESLDREITKWANRWHGYQHNNLSSTRGNYDYDKTQHVQQLVASLRTAGLQAGCTRRELDAVSYGYARMLLADMYSQEGTDNGANSSFTNRGLDGAYDEGTDNGKWMGGPKETGEYDGGMSCLGRVLSAEELLDEETEQASEADDFIQLAFTLKEANDGYDTEGSEALEQSAWEVMSAAIVGNAK